MVREMSTTNSEDCVGGSDPNSDPNSDHLSLVPSENMARDLNNPSPSEDPPSYEESLGDGGWDSNLTWPNTLVNRDELAQIFRLNNYDYATRGRAFTVSGPAEIQAPRYRNIINYFENSLEDMSSIEWSASSGIQRSALQLQGSHYSCSDLEVSHTHITRTGPKSHTSGAKNTSKDVIHWEYINEINPNSRTRFTVRLVPETDEEPPNYSLTGNPRDSGLFDVRPSSTSGTCVINTDDDRHCELSGDYTSHSGPHLSKQPSAPSLDQINQPDPIMRRSESWYSAGPQLGRTVTAPAILEKPGVLESQHPSVEEGKTVSFYLGDDMSSTNLERKAEQAMMYDEADYTDHNKKECRSSETGDSGYGDEGCPITDTTPLKISDIGIKPHDSYHRAIPIDKGNSRTNLMSHPNDWENHRLFRSEEPRTETSFAFWVALLFFLCDIVMIISGALLLILNYHENVIIGFVLLGIGIGMCIPALNYIGGFPTLCAGIQS